MVVAARIKRGLACVRNLSRQRQSMSQSVIVPKHLCPEFVSGRQNVRVALHIVM